jgi:hypothetical protein
MLSEDIQVTNLVLERVFVIKYVLEWDFATRGTKFIQHGLFQALTVSPKPNLCRELRHLICRANAQEDNTELWCDVTIVVRSKEVIVEELLIVILLHGNWSLFVKTFRHGR